MSLHIQTQYTCVIYPSWINRQFLINSFQSSQKWKKCHLLAWRSFLDKIGNCFYYSHLRNAEGPYSQKQNYIYRTCRKNSKSPTNNFNTIIFTTWKLANETSVSKEFFKTIFRKFLYITFLNISQFLSQDSRFIYLIFSMCSISHNVM